MGIVGGHGCVSQIFVIPLHGGNPEQFTFLTQNEAHLPAWSPDGAQFAYVAVDGDGYIRRLAVMAATPGALRTILATHSGLNVLSPQWSPDGTRIAYFAISFVPPVLTSNLYVISSGGGTPNHLAGPFASTGLSWSPDGTTIAYNSDQSGSSDIWVMPSTGGVATRLTMGDGGEYRPAWSPDGAVIAYIAQGQIWGIAPTGGPSFLLVTDTGVTVGKLAWSPDGRSMAYTKGTPSNIWVASVEVRQ
jgi:TolB protein